MALQKTIRQDDGVITSYHRILFIESAINARTSIGVTSYIDDVSRGEQLSGTMASPYRVNRTYETGYIEGITPEQAYAYLKTLPEFEGAVDT